jgi:hypothetical protein
VVIVRERAHIHNAVRSAPHKRRHALGCHYVSLSIKCATSDRPYCKPLIRQNIFVLPEAVPSCTLSVPTNCRHVCCHFWQTLLPRHSDICYPVSDFNSDNFVTCRIARTAGWSAFGTAGMITGTYLKIDVIRYYRIKTDVLHLCFTLTSRSNSQQIDVCL